MKVIAKKRATLLAAVGACVGLLSVVGVLWWLMK